MMQNAIVALIVLYASGFVAWRFLPKTLRRMLRTRLADAAGRRGWNRLERRLRAAPRKAASCSDGCGSCGGCDDDASRSAGERPVGLDTLRSRPPR